ncbi:MAG: trypsin-like peptidase domain-containing protein [Bacilli bacterium]|nr:trypsin-like peptidase domain-containing protein [Bacilli bacterium]MDD4077672.1 trypsin-like peptidase domain-containing protein [Bacilli bacterium]MDD4388622.1 trypsin-like peptidase domain-containing protein [Bacilli bacterium]
MKKRVSIVVLLLVIFFLSGCFYSGIDNVNNGSTSVIEETNYKVTFVVDGIEKGYKIVSNMQIFGPMEAPKKENYIFAGWFTEDGKEFLFDKPINESIYLYAKYTPNYSALINKISTEIIKSNVEIRVKNYNTFLGFETESITSSGSGIIIADAHGYYYILTNSHVVYKREGYSHIQYTVQDYIGNTYSASILNNSIDPNYDLATLVFKKGSTMLSAIQIAKKNPLIGEEIIALGQPKGQNNTITFGKVLNYRKVNFSEPIASSTVNFPVAVHNAPIDCGSSGGAILNVGLNLVGINFAGSSSNNDFISAVAIPIEKVWEYLYKYVRTDGK